MQVLDNQPSLMFWTTLSRSFEVQAKEAVRGPLFAPLFIWRGPLTLNKAQHSSKRRSAPATRAFYAFSRSSSPQSRFTPTPSTPKPSKGASLRPLPIPRTNSASKPTQPRNSARLALDRRVRNALPHALDEPAHRRRQLVLLHLIVPLRLVHLAAARRPRAKRGPQHRPRGRQ